MAHLNLAFHILYVIRRKQSHSYEEKIEIVKLRRVRYE
jgi:hypothetical protein